MPPAGLRVFTSLGSNRRPLLARPAWVGAVAVIQVTTDSSQHICLAPQRVDHSVTSIPGDSIRANMMIYVCAAVCHKT